MNPMQIAQMLMNQNPNMKQNPILSNAMNMAKTNDVDGLKKIAENLAQSRGVNLQDVQKQVMQKFGIQ